MSTTTRKRITLALVLCLALTLVVGSFAFFTDKFDTSASAQAGNIDLTWTDAATNLSGAAEDVKWEANFDADDIMNPGDTYDFSYTVANTGSKSIDVKQQLVLTSDVALTDDAEEYTLTITGGKDTVVVEPTKSTNDMTLTYDLTDIVLKGTVEEEGDAKASEDYTVKLSFDLDADNDFMNKGITMSYQAYAKQHRNAPDAEWALVADYQAVE